jgi:hypothetical protein
MILDKLDKLSGGNEEMQIAILDKSVVKCWSDVYELRERYTPSKYKESSQEKADRLLAEVMADTEV